MKQKEEDLAGDDKERVARIRLVMHVKVGLKKKKKEKEVKLINDGKHEGEGYRMKGKELE